MKLDSFYQAAIEEHGTLEKAAFAPLIGLAARMAAPVARAAVAGGRTMLRHPGKALTGAFLASDAVSGASQVASRTGSGAKNFVSQAVGSV